MIKAQSAKDADEKSALQKEVTEATKKADVEVPKLFMEAVKKYPNTFAGGRAALTLLQRKTVNATPEELKNWAEIASKGASEFGPIWNAETNTQIASFLLGRKNTDLAVQYAKLAEQSLDDTCTTDLQVKVIEGLITAHKQAGTEAAVGAFVERLVRLNKVLDDEYVTKVPPFKGTPFAGRKAKSERAVVMELFTGAQCPPCVAADVAFDVLEKTYAPRDLVLIQYHMHIPGPDPMTNTDTEARWKYYRDAYGAKGVPGTPTTLFNGIVKGGGGGGMAQAEAKYDAYRAIIDPLLEEPDTCSVSSSAKRVGDKVRIQTNVTGLEKAGKDMKLRLFLLEDTVRFVGVDHCAFTIRWCAMPGGSDGVAVTEASLKTDNEIDLRDLRTQSDQLSRQLRAESPAVSPTGSAHGVPAPTRSCHRAGRRVARNLAGDGGRCGELTQVDYQTAESQKRSVAPRFFVRFSVAARPRVSEPLREPGTRLTHPQLSRRAQRLGHHRAVRSAIEIGQW